MADGIIDLSGLEFSKPLGDGEGQPGVQKFMGHSRRNLATGTRTTPAAVPPQQETPWPLTFLTGLT